MFKLNHQTKTILRKILPMTIIDSIRTYKRFSLDYGHLKSIFHQQAIDKNNQPIPWITYPALDYIQQLDLSDKTLFEFGSGNSTLFWSKNCKKVYSIESDLKWYNQIKQKIEKNVDYQYISDLKDYSLAINKFKTTFDIIFIDGKERELCAKEAINKLHPQGFIILDNSDWYHPITEFLRKNDFIQIDMSGFGPINGYTSSTSFFFRRNVQLKPKLKNQPINKIC